MPAESQNESIEPSSACRSIAELLARWRALGGWAVEKQHGAAAKLVVMFALSLQRPTSAHTSSIRYRRPRVWVVSTPYGATTQRVSLLEDALVTDLLSTIDATEGRPTPVSCELHAAPVALMDGRMLWLRAKAIEA